MEEEGGYLELIGAIVPQEGRAERDVRWSRVVNFNRKLRCKPDDEMVSLAIKILL